MECSGPEHVAVQTGTSVDGRPCSAMVLGPALSDDTVLHVAAGLLDEPRPGERVAMTQTGKRFNGPTSAR